MFNVCYIILLTFHRCSSLKNQCLIVFKLIAITFMKRSIFQEVYQYYLKSLILQRNDVLTPTFNKFMLRMFDHGIIMKAQNDLLLSRGNNNDKIRSDPLTL